VFTQIDWTKLSDPSFSQETVAQLDDAVSRGARGLKRLKDLGLGVKNKNDKLIAVDDPRLDPVWEECGRPGLPVSIHVSGPEAFFHPIDSTNERYEELIEHPDWRFYGPQFPSKIAILEARDRAIARHSYTTFVEHYLANWPENLGYVAAELGKYPNLMVEWGQARRNSAVSPAAPAISLSSIRTESCLATTTEWTKPCTAIISAGWKPPDEYFDYWGYPAQGGWKIYGMGLLAAVLEKIYHLNAERMFRQFKSGAAQKGAE